MTESEIILVVCEALTTITRDLTDHGTIDIHDVDILDVTFKQLQFDTLDRVELALILEEKLECGDIDDTVFNNWNKISDVVEYIKTI